MVVVMVIVLLSTYFFLQTLSRSGSETSLLLKSFVFIDGFVVIVCHPMFSLQHVTPVRTNGWTPLLLLVCLTVTLGTTIPVGYFFGVLNAPAEIIKKWCQDILASEYDTIVTSGQLDILWTSIVSIYLIGGICGSCFSALCSEKYGR